MDRVTEQAAIVPHGLGRLPEACEDTVTHMARSLLIAFRGLRHLQIETPVVGPVKATYEPSEDAFERRPVRRVYSPVDDTLSLPVLPGLSVQCAEVEEDELFPVRERMPSALYTMSKPVGSVALLLGGERSTIGFWLGVATEGTTSFRNSNFPVSNNEYPTATSLYSGDLSLTPSAAAMLYQEIVVIADSAAAGMAAFGVKIKRQDRAPRLFRDLESIAVRGETSERQAFVMNWMDEHFPDLATPD